MKTCLLTLHPIIELFITEEAKALRRPLDCWLKKWFAFGKTRCKYKKALERIFIKRQLTDTDNLKKIASIVILQLWGQQKIIKGGNLLKFLFAHREPNLMAA